MTLESLPLGQYSRNELISSLLARTPMNFDMPDTRRKFMMDKRGDGVPVLYSESISVPGKKPVYELIDDTELKLTIFAGEAEFGPNRRRPPKTQKPRPATETKAEFTYG